MYKKFIFLLLLLPHFLLARGKVVYEEVETGISPPWLTGPLISSSPQVIPGGHYNIEPYIFVAAIPAYYTASGSTTPVPTFWSVISQTSIQIGVTSWMDAQINPTFAWNYSQHAGKAVLNDWPIGIDIQLYEASRPTIPSLKLILKEVVPLGKYQNLNPQKHSTDAGGLGFWGTQIGLATGQLFYLGGKHFLNWRFDVIYSFPSSVHLNGFNSHGGGYGTDVRFFPAKSFTADLGLEFTLSQNWALALDAIGFWTTKTRYHGFHGTTAEGEPATIGHGKWAQYSFAPAIEYNWSADLGLIAGTWFTFTGSRAPTFYNGVIAFNYYH